MQDSGDTHLSIATISFYGKFFGPDSYHYAQLSDTRQPWVPHQQHMHLQRQPAAAACTTKLHTSTTGCLSETAQYHSSPFDLGASLLPCSSTQFLVANKATQCTLSRLSPPCILVLSLSALLPSCCLLQGPSSLTTQAAMSTRADTKHLGPNAIRHLAVTPTTVKAQPCPSPGSPATRAIKEIRELPDTAPGGDVFRQKQQSEAGVFGTCCGRRSLQHTAQGSTVDLMPVLQQTHHSTATPHPTCTPKAGCRS